MQNRGACQLLVIGSSSSAARTAAVSARHSAKYSWRNGSGRRAVASRTNESQVNGGRLVRLGRTNINPGGTLPWHKSTSTAAGTTGPKQAVVTNAQGSGTPGGAGYTAGIPGYWLDANGNYVNMADGIVYCGNANSVDCEMPTGSLQNYTTEPVKPTYVWRPGRPDVDDGPQGPIADENVVQSGADAGAGSYIFVQKLDGSVLAMNEELYENGTFPSDSDWPGHTSLADHEPVLFAGRFTVDGGGNVTEMTRGSGHYQPGSHAPAYNPDDYMLLRDVAAQALALFGLNVPEGLPLSNW